MYCLEKYVGFMNVHLIFNWRCLYFTYRMYFYTRCPDSQTIQTPLPTYSSVVYEHLCIPSVECVSECQP